MLVTCGWRYVFQVVLNGDNIEMHPSCVWLQAWMRYLLDRLHCEYDTTASIEWEKLIMKCHRTNGSLVLLVGSFTLGVVVCASQAQPFAIEARPLPEGVEVEYPSKSDAYYQFERAPELLSDAIGWSIMDMALGETGLRQWLDASVSDADRSAYYRVREIPQAAPEDADGDGIGDVYELQYPGVLHPLRNSDAHVDSDGDMITNVDEFRRGSDPTQIDPPVWTMETPFDGMVIGGY